MNISIAKKRLAAVTKPDSITTSRGDFLITHVEIKKLILLNKFEFAPNSQDYISEEDIYKKYIMNPDNKHQFIIVYGHNGTGKSHLIRWFEAKYETDKPDNEVVLFIRRSDNTLKGTIRQLLEKPEVKNIRNKDIIKRLVNASMAVPENKLKDMIYHNFIIEIDNDNNEQEITLGNVKRKRLVAFLNNEKVHDYMMKPEGPIERIYSKVAENSLTDPDIIAQFKPEDFLIPIELYEEMERDGADSKALKMGKKLIANDSNTDAKMISEYLNQFVSVVIQQCAGIEPGDFEQIFKDIRKELYRLGKNLTLFIEDVTSFTGVDQALLNALMEEHNDRNICRLSSVVGGTNAYILDFFRDNHRDRVTQYIYIPDNVFDENGLFEFVGRYINAMSLSTDKITQWLESKTLPEDYPVHEVTEGKNWEYIQIPYEKKLCLYPFSKNSIRYLYKNVLTKSNQTPRYIIRDIIEPVISDLLYNESKFPSKNYAIANFNTTLNTMVHNQVKDNEQADRLFRFMSIWGNNKAKQFTHEGITYISGLPSFIYEELGLPVINLQETKIEMNQDSESGIKQEIVSELKPESASKTIVAPEKQKRVDDAISLLTKWVSGMSIDLAITGGTENVIRAAREDMGNFVLSAINWQAEGISSDNIAKVRATIHGRSTKNKLIALENQIGGEGYYILPADWGSLNIIIAFIRWREYGNGSWDYEKSDLDAYITTSWISRIKKQIVQSVQLYDGKNKTNYIEAAIAAEIYCLILNGEYTGKSLGGLKEENLLCNYSMKNKKTYHSTEWNSLLSVMHTENADNKNKETVRKYFNLVQGSGGTVVVLDAVNFSETVKKVKKRRLHIPKEELQLDDRVKQRKDTYSFYNDIAIRIDRVAKAEVEAARKAMQPVYDCFDDEVEETDIRNLISEINNFYDEINATQINIKAVSTENIKRKTKKITKAIREIIKAIDEKDPLTILMAFSDDPIGTLQPFITLINQLKADLDKVDKQLEKRNNKLGPIGVEEEENNLYKDEVSIIDTDIALLEVLK